jgi:hypothetical protein
MGLQSFERGLERMVDGVFSRAFRSSIKPIELGRRIIRDMDDHRTVDVRGRTVVPNAFTIFLNPQDLQSFSDVNDALVRELQDAATEYSRDEGYSLMGPVVVDLQADERARAGRFTVTSRMLEPRALGHLVLPSGERRPLGEHVVTMGRLPDNDIVVADANVSRRHAEIRPVGGHYVLVDLKSTNGVRVNGTLVTQQALQPGDTITLGGTVLRFEVS